MAKTAQPAPLPALSTLHAQPSAGRAASSVAAAAASLATTQPAPTPTTATAAAAQPAAAWVPAG